MIVLWSGPWLSSISIVNNSDNGGGRGSGGLDKANS